MKKNFYIIILVVVAVIAMASLIRLSIVESKYNSAMECISASAELLLECEQYIDELTDGAFCDTIAEGQAFDDFVVTYYETTGIIY